MVVRGIYEVRAVLKKFDAEAALGFPSFPSGFEDMRVEEQWRSYYAREQKFQSYCTNCRSDQFKPRIIVSSSSSDSEETEYKVDLTDTAKTILELWRYETHAAQERRALPSLSMPLRTLSAQPSIPFLKR